MNLKNNSIVRDIYFLILRIRSYFIFKSNLCYCANNVTINPPIFIVDYKKIKIGEGSSIGMHAYISNLNANFIVKEHCAIAERLTVHCGNHARVPGMFITDITEAIKPKGYDKDVIIEEDVWIGCNVTLLCGVTIGRASTVAAGSVVTKSIPPYCICGGVPAKVIKFYWTIDQILEHELKLYSKNERFTREKLEELFAKYEKNK